MDRTKDAGRSGRRIIHRVLVAAAGTAAAGLLALAAISIVAPAPASDTERTAAPQTTAWGSEALRVARDRAFEWAPFAVANACGIGASSCFKCHNGNRAAAPKSDKKTDPWHPDHQTVNDSCVGCHGGNARIIKKEIAHTKMVKNPLTTPDACTHCHKSGDESALLKKYQQVASATGGK